MYEYRVIDVVNVVDGDTVDVRISLGFGLRAALRVRLLGVDTPEVYGPNASDAGRAARAFTAEWLAAIMDRGAGRLVLATYKGSQQTVGIGDGAFGRWLGSFYDGMTGESLTLALTEQGWTS